MPDNRNDKVHGSIKEWETRQQ